MFTYFLLDGMNGAADSNQSLTVDLTELSDYAADKVPEYTQKHFKRRQNPFIWHAAEQAGTGPTLIKLK